MRTIHIFGLKRSIKYTEGGWVVFVVHRFMLHEVWRAELGT
jgi:hypothetical protein